jgi:hypothetical protein
MDELRELCTSDPDTKAYLNTKVFPTVRECLELLLTELARRQVRVDEGEELPPIQPLLFLAQNLMRRNPQDAPPS